MAIILVTCAILVSCGSRPSAVCSDDIRAVVESTAIAIDSAFDVDSSTIVGCTESSGQGVGADLLFDVAAQGMEDQIARYLINEGWAESDHSVAGLRRLKYSFSDEVFLEATISRQSQAERSERLIVSLLAVTNH